MPYVVISTAVIMPSASVVKVAVSVMVYRLKTLMTIMLLVVAVMTRFFGKNKSFAEGLRVWPFAIFAALAMTIPYVIIAHLAGPAFPSLLGALIGLAIVVPAAKAGFLMPKEHWDFPPKAGNFDISTFC